MSKRQHIVISGTGRAGTSFLVELLTHLGLDTGFDVDKVSGLKDVIGRAGLEHDIRRESCPYVVKSPWFCDYAEEIIKKNDIAIEHIFIPIRDLHAAAESRRLVTESGSQNGGLWYTESKKPGDQEKILMSQLYKLMLAVSASDVPVTLIRYPLLTRDPSYLYDKLRPVLKGIDFQFFLAKYESVVDPRLTNVFNANDV